MIIFIIWIPLLHLYLSILKIRALKCFYFPAGKRRILSCPQIEEKIFFRFSRGRQADLTHCRICEIQILFALIYLITQLDSLEVPFLIKRNAAMVQEIAVKLAVHPPFSQRKRTC